MKKVVTILLVLVVAFSLGARGSSEEKASPVSTGPVSGGTLNVAVTGNPTSLLSWVLRGPIDRAYGCVIFEKLFNFDENGDPIPYLLDSYEQDPKALTYTFHIKKGVKFHDGSDLNAEVVKWNIDIYKEKGVQRASFLGSLDYVEIVDEFTVVLHLNTWDALIPFVMAREGGCGYIQSKLAYETYGESWAKENPVTTAPFKFVAWNRDTQVVLERFDEYWQGKPYLDGITFVMFQDIASAQAAFLTGDVHAMMNATREVAEVLGSQGFNIVVGGIPAQCYTVGFNSLNKNDPFSDLRVRQAASHVMDREIIATVLFGDFGEATTQYARKGTTYYNNEVDGYPYNIEKAKKLMAEAGYANGFSTQIHANATSADSVKLAQILVETLSKINIKAEIKLYDTAAYTSLVDGWERGLFIHGMGMDAGVAPQIAGSYKDGLTSGIGLKAFDRPENLGKIIAEGSASDTAGLIENFKIAQRVIFQDSLLLNALAVNFPIAITSPKVHDAGFGATVSTSADVWDAWLGK